MKILTFAGSLRRDSLNKKLCQQALSYIQSEKLAEIEYIDLQPLQIPVYDGDIESQQGLPAGVSDLVQRIQAATALIISSPENNGAIAAALKNAIDWVSRQKPQHPLMGKHILLCAASPGALGGVRGLWHTRVPFEALGCHVFPEMFGLPKAHEAFGVDGNLLDEKNRKNFERVLQTFIQYVK